MTTIDRAALIEAAAKAPRARKSHQGTIEAALPVIARELLAPLRELHRSEFRSECRLYFCVSCGVAEPCPTVLLLDQIEADVKGVVAP